MYDHEGRTSLYLRVVLEKGETNQSLGLLPLTTTLITTCSGPGSGIELSTISTLGPLLTMASFIFDMQFKSSNR
jgi:hypothetical protein